MSTVGFPIEWLGPECETCGHRHQPGRAHVRMLTREEVDAIRAVLPDEAPQ